MSSNFINQGAAIGLQVLYSFLTIGLLFTWVVQLMRFSNVTHVDEKDHKAGDNSKNLKKEGSGKKKNVKVEVDDKADMAAIVSQRILLGLFMVLLMGAECADPLAELNVMDGRLVRVISLFMITGCGMWCVLNGSHHAAFLLMIVGLKYKEEEELTDQQKQLNESQTGEDEETGCCDCIFLTAEQNLEKKERARKKALKTGTSEEKKGMCGRLRSGKWDRFELMPMTIGITWLIFGIVLAVLLFVDPETAEKMCIAYLVFLFLGVLTSLVVTAHALKQSFKVKLGSRDQELNHRAKEGRRRQAAEIYQILVYHGVLILLLIIDLVLGAPTGEEINGHLQGLLITYALFTRLALSFQFWFAWIPEDDSSFTEKLEQRRNKYKVYSVDRMIDERVLLEREKESLHQKTICSPDVLSKLYVAEIELEDVDSEMKGRQSDYMAEQLKRFNARSRDKDNLKKFDKKRKEQSKLFSPADSDAEFAFKVENRKFEDAKTPLHDMKSSGTVNVSSPEYN